MHGRGAGDELASDDDDTAIVENRNADSGHLVKFLEKQNEILRKQLIIEQNKYREKKTRIKDKALRKAQESVE